MFLFLFGGGGDWLSDDISPFFGFAVLPLGLSGWVELGHSDTPTPALTRSISLHPWRWI